MRFSMRFALLAGLLLFAACAGDDHDHAHIRGGGGGKGGSGGKPDAGVVDSGNPQSKLDRPGTLSRPPGQGLPAELRPPR